MRIYFHVFFLVFSVLSCSRLLGPDTSGLSQEELLNLAYQKKSNRILGQFFSRWHQEIKPITEEELTSQSETLQTVYKLFDSFFKEHDGSRWNRVLYKGRSYFIVQGKVSYRLVEEPGKHGLMSVSSREEHQQFLASRDSIDNFRPIVKSSKTKVVYLTEKYETLLYNFVGMNRLTKEESSHRLHFLTKQIKISLNHWGNWWHMINHPEIWHVEFDKKLQTAYMEYYFVAAGGSAYFDKTPQGWEFSGEGITWQE